jgi:hypothetical protein
MAFTLAKTIIPEFHLITVLDVYSIEPIGAVTKRRRDFPLATWNTGQLFSRMSVHEKLSSYFP